MSIEQNRNNSSTPFHQVDWDEEACARGFVEEALRLKDEYNRDIERQSELNAAWYRGYQDYFWNKNSARIERQIATTNRVRLTANYLRSLVNGFVAKLHFNPIRLTAEPATDDLLDFERARLQTKVFQHYQSALAIPTVSTRADKTVLLSGEAYLKCVWDAKRGTELPPINPDEIGLGDAEYRAIFGDRRTIYTGDIVVSALKAHNVFWGPPGCDFEDAEWVLEVYEEPAGTVADRYDLDPATLVADDDDNYLILRPGDLGIAGTATRQREEGTIIVKELWCKANKTLPGLARGRHVIVAGSQLVKNKPNPYKHQTIPIVQIICDYSPDTNRGTTCVTDMCILQADMNRGLSQFCESRELTANPHTYAHENAIVDEREWNSRIGGVRRWRGAHEPHDVPGQTLPVAAVNMISIEQRMMQDMIGLRDVSQGKNPAGVRAARSIALLKEADDERMAVFNTSRVRAWETIGWLMLKTLEQYATEDRVLRIAGDEFKTRVRYFSGKRLKGTGLGASRYDVRVLTNGFPRSRSARLEDMDRLMERGFLRPDDPKDKAYVMSVINGDDREGLDARAPARELMIDRCLMMARGQYEAPAHYENLQVMLETMNEFQHRPFYRRFSDDIRKLFEQYEVECLKLMALSTPRKQLIAQQALTEAGLLPAQSPTAQTAPPGRANPQPPAVMENANAE